MESKYEEKKFAIPVLGCVCVVVFVAAEAEDEDEEEAPKSSGRRALRGETVALFEIRSLASRCSLSFSFGSAEAMATVVAEEPVADEDAGEDFPFALFSLPLSDAVATRGSWACA